MKNALSVQDKNRPTAEMLKDLEIDRQLEEWIQEANLVRNDLGNDSPQG